MGKENVTRFRCDICVKSKTSGTTPPGWVEITREIPQQDRDFIENVICDDCVERILRAANATVRGTA